MGQTQVCVLEVSRGGLDGGRFSRGPVDDPPVNLGPQTQESGKIKAPWSRPTFDRWVSINPTVIGSAAEMSPLIFSRYLDLQL